MIANAEFKKYLDGKKDLGYEGIREVNPYKIGIKKVGDNYLGFIIKSGAAIWKKWQIKLRIVQTSGKMKATFYLRDYSPDESNSI